jgi:hypothetical protein
MITLALLISFLTLALSNDCRWECDIAFADYAYNVCWIQQYYGDAPILNEECVAQCVSTAAQCLEDNGCFNEGNTWCDSWNCDCSYQCDYYSQCYDKVYQEGLCEFQKTCYDACPASSAQEEQDDNCVETYCYDELAACANQDGCVAAVEGVIGDCFETDEIDSVQCVEDIESTPEKLISYCNDEGVCLELFQSLATCVVVNQCHKEHAEHEATTKPNFAQSVKEYKRRKDSIKRKIMAKRQRDQRNKEMRRRELKQKRQQTKSTNPKSAFARYRKSKL